MSETIKPCPFCGNEAAIWDNPSKPYFVACSKKDCDAYGPSRSTPDAAIAAWNAAPRPEPARTCATCGDLLDYLYSTTEQACATEGGAWDSGGIANYADAMLKLEQHGLLLVTTKRGRRVIAQPRPRPVAGQEAQP